MKLRRGVKLIGVLMAISLVAAACGSDDDDSQAGSANTTLAGAGTGTNTTVEDSGTATDTTTGSSDNPPPSFGDLSPGTAVLQDCSDGVEDVKLQLQWFTQAQFAGYYAAKDTGIYEKYCLDVEILEGAVEIVPITVLDSGGADFAVSWVPRGLVPRQEGINAVNVAQVFERSGTLQVSFADSGIGSVGDLRGKKVGNWGFGNEFELLAGLRKNNLNPDSDISLVQQNFDMQALLNGEIDAAQAMIYNEYAQVLETINPETGELYQPSDLSVINWNDEGTAMLQDALWADGDRLAEDATGNGYRRTTERFVQASLEGWIYCRDNAADCVDIVLDNGPTLGRSHQTWQMNEINGLIWPSTRGIGALVPTLWEQTVTVAVDEDILQSAPSDDAYDTFFAVAALANLQADGVDVGGERWSKQNVTLKEGGN